MVQVFRREYFPHHQAQRVDVATQRYLAPRQLFRCHIGRRTAANVLYLARQARQKVREGIDPIEERRAARSALMASAAKVMTFKDAADALIATKQAEWNNPKHRN